MFVINQRNQIISSFSKLTIIQRRLIMNDDDKIKINKSNIYHENRNELNDWFTQIDVYFVFNKMSNDKQTLFVFIFLRDRTKRWFKSRLKQYLNDEKNENDVFFNYGQLQEENSTHLRNFQRETNDKTKYSTFYSKDFRSKLRRQISKTSQFYWVKRRRTYVNVSTRF